jgi:hypothetical protein
MGNQGQTAAGQINLPSESRKKTSRNPSYRQLHKFEEGKLARDA